MGFTMGFILGAGVAGAAALGFMCYAAAKYGPHTSGHSRAVAPGKG